jgi:hypothetical protein
MTNELFAMELTAELVKVLVKIVDEQKGVTADDDKRELIYHVHVIQRAILAQAAARAYPGRFRLLGGVVDE